MIAEEKVFASFPGSENKRMRHALLLIVWAYEALEGEEALVGPTFNRIVSKGAGVSFDRNALIGLIEDSATKMRGAAAMLEQAVESLTHGA